MQATFDAYWQHARNSIALTEMLLDPMPPHTQQCLGAAQYPAVAKRAIDLFPYPGDIHNWILDADKAAA